MKTLYESILDSNKEVVKNTEANIFISKIIDCVDNFKSGTSGASIGKTLNDLWKEYDLEIPGMEWYVTRYGVFNYGLTKGFFIPVVCLICDDREKYLAIRSRKGIDYDIERLNSYWEKKAKQETRKITDDFLKKYDKKIDKVLNMQPDKEKTDYFINMYTLQ